MTAHEQEDGFTVIELLMSMTILTVIVGTISSALIVFLSNGSYSLGRDDHSGGAAILASYLDRDLASAETAVYDTGAPCSSASKDLVLRWDEWIASSTAVTPVAGQSYSAAYDLVPDADGTQRLERWYCRGTTQLSHSVLLTSLSSGDISASASASCGSGSSPLVVTLERYRQDNLADYAYSGCLRGRLG